MSPDAFQHHVKEAASKAGWKDKHDPGELVKLLRQRYTKSHLLKHEVRLSGILDFPTHCPDFSLGAHFAAAGTRPSLQYSSNHTGPDTFSTQHVDLTECGSCHYGNDEDFTSKKGTPYAEAGELSLINCSDPLETNYYKDCGIYSPDRREFIPVIAADRKTEHTWISADVLIRLHFEETLIDVSQVKETVGHKELVSQGLVHLRIHPHDCPTSFVWAFNISRDKVSFDVFIGRALTMEVERVQHSALSFEATREFAVMPEVTSWGAASCPPSIPALKAGTRPEDSSRQDARTQGRRSRSAGASVVGTSNHSSDCHDFDASPPPIRATHPPSWTNSPGFVSLSSSMSMFEIGSISHRFLVYVLLPLLILGGSVDLIVNSIGPLDDATLGKSLFYMSSLYTKYLSGRTSWLLVISGNLVIIFAFVLLFWVCHTTTRSANDRSTPTAQYQS